MIFKLQVFDSSFAGQGICRPGWQFVVITLGVAKDVSLNLQPGRAINGPCPHRGAVRADASPKDIAATAPTKPALCLFRRLEPLQGRPGYGQRNSRASGGCNKVAAAFAALHAMTSDDGPQRANDGIGD